MTAGDFWHEIGWDVDIVDTALVGKDHDAWSVAEHAACVVDGATPLEADWPNDLKPFSRAIAAALVGARAGGPVQGIWEDAIVALRAQFSPAGYRRSAGAALVRATGTKLEFSTMGDVMCLVATDESTLLVLDPTLIELDRQAEFAGTRQALIDNRRKANMPDGYAVFSDDPRASDKLTTLTVDASRVRAFALLSDGAWRHLDPNPAVALESLCHGNLREAFHGQVKRSGRALADDATIIRFMLGDRGLASIEA